MEIILDFLIFLLFLVALVCFFIGLIKPSLFSKFFKKRTSRKATSLFFGSVLVILIIAIVSIQTKTEKKEALSLYNQAETSINNHEVDNALQLLDDSIKLYESEENPSFGLKSEIEKLQSIEFLKNSLVNMSEVDFEKLINNQLATPFINNQVLNSLFIDKLKENSGQRDSYIKEAQELTKRKQDEAEIQRKIDENIIKEQEDKNAVEARKKQIESQFSAWDGSHINLAKTIKNSMNDPKSYEHVETTYQDTGEYLIVQTKFRGANAFGGLVLNTIRAKVSIDGNIIEIIETN